MSRWPRSRMQGLSDHLQRGHLGLGIVANLQRDLIRHAVNSTTATTCVRLIVARVAAGTGTPRKCFERHAKSTPSGTPALSSITSSRTRPVEERWTATMDVHLTTSPVVTSNPNVPCSLTIRPLNQAGSSRTASSGSVMRVQSIARF